MGVLFGFGQRMLFDAQQRFVRSGLPVYLRVRSWKENPSDGTSSDYLEVGVPISPTGAAGVDVGYNDILIQPRPNVVDTNNRNVGLLAARLNFGSQVFYVSHTFVLEQMRALKLTDPYAVWRDRDGCKAIGLVYNGGLFSIETVLHRAAGGEIVSWKLVGNAQEGSNDSS